MNTLDIHIDGIGLLGPGLPNWQDAKNILAGQVDWVFAKPNYPVLDCLPPAERRRMGVLIKLSMAVGFEAVRHAQADAAQLATVFSSTEGDCDNCHHILDTLASDDRAISPTRFHNSVHNAPSGYWSIATHCMQPSTSLCAYDATFAAGLLETATQAITSGQPCLLLAYEAVYPEPLFSLRPIPYEFGVGLVVSPRKTAQTKASLRLSFTDATPDKILHTELEQLRNSIPAGRVLPLLELLAKQATGSVVVEYLSPLQLEIEVLECY